jgi:hypothetical protein
MLNLDVSKIRKISGWLSDHEARLLYNFAKIKSNDPGEIVEIGSYKGKSTICLAKGIEYSGRLDQVYTVDPHLGEIKKGIKSENSTYDALLKNLQDFDVSELVKPVINTSVGFAKKWNKPIKLLFIDGLHDYEHANQDYLAWNKFVLRNGIIAFHDGFCGIDGVWQAINEHFLDSNTLINVGTVASILYGVRGKPSLMTKVSVIFKIWLVRLATTIHQDKNISKELKKFMIHRVIRFILLNKYTMSVYLE